MSAIRITRLNPRTGRLERPWRNREGLFVLGDPTHGAQKHHDKYAVKVTTLTEAAGLVRRGFSLRMTDGQTPPSLITSDSLTLEEVDGEDGPSLWAETGPAAPFDKDAVMDELRRTLLVQASQVAHAASLDAAIAFAGFETENEAYPYCEENPSRLDLSRFRATSYMDVAYDYAFQVGQYWRFGDDTAQDVREWVRGANMHDSAGVASPLANPDGPLRRAADTALARWKLGHGNGLTVRELALLAGMTGAAVRNALSRERVAVEHGEVDGEAALQWLKARRDFMPTRTDEGDAQRWAAHSRWLLDHRPFAEAFADILRGVGLTAAALAEKAGVPEPFVDALRAGRPGTDLGALRRVAEALDLDAPHFAGAAVRAALAAV